LVTTFGSFSETLELWNSGTGFNFFTQGIRGNVLPLGTLTFPAVVTTILTTGISIAWGGQHYWMRVISARNEKQALFTVVVGGMMLFFVSFIIVVMGFFAGAHFHQDILAGTIPIDQMYGTLLRSIPSFAAVYFIVFAIAAAISTLSSLLIGCVQIAIRDFYKQFINRNPSDGQLTRASRIATVLICVTCWAMSLYPGGVVFLIAFASSWMAPAGYLTFFGIISRRLNATGAMVGTLIALVVMTTWSIFNLFNIPVGGQNIATYIHVVALIPIFLIVPAYIVSYLTESKYYGRKDWVLGKGIEFKKV
jgi:SSS family solute:Na+ symporter